MTSENKQPETRVKRKYTRRQPLAPKRTPRAIPKRVDAPVKDVKKCLTLDEKYQLIEFLKANKERIETERIPIPDILEDCSTLIGRPISRWHLNGPIEVAGVTFARGGARKPVIVKADTRLLLTFALMIRELYARLGDLVGGEPRLLEQAIEQLHEELRKEMPGAPVKESLAPDQPNNEE